jgi:Zn-dependent peptidase ImmA (M78 family)
MTIRRKHISGVVNRLLNQHGIQAAPVPVEDIARSLGARVERTPADDELSGFLYQQKNSKLTIIGVNENHHPNRQAFTIAHELGHSLLHDVDDVHVDRNFRIKLRNSASSKGENVEEMEANLFAAELLMPTSFLKKDLKTIEDVDLVDEGVISKLAGRYGVSTQAMTIRLSHLGYVRL